MNALLRTSRVVRARSPHIFFTGTQSPRGIVYPAGQPSTANLVSLAVHTHTHTYCLAARALCVVRCMLSCVYGRTLKKVLYTKTGRAFLVSAGVFSLLALSTGLWLFTIAAPYFYWFGAPTTFLMFYLLFSCESLFPLTASTIPSPPPPPPLPSPPNKTSHLTPRRFWC